MQDPDPHHTHENPIYFYVFFILAPILVAVVLYIAWKVMSYLESKTERRKSGRNEKDSQAVSESQEKAR